MNQQKMFVKLLYFLNNTLSFIYDLTYSTYLCGPVFALSSHIVMQIRLHYSTILNAFNKILLVRHEFYPQTIKKNIVITAVPSCVES